MFPNGRAGVGLLLLRVVAAIGLAWYGYGYLQLSLQDHTSTTLVVAIIDLATGLALLVGYLTPVAATFGVLLNFGGAFGLSLSSKHVPWETRLSAAFIAILALALFCLGPGAFSVDAKRHGHREITIPQKQMDPPDQ